MPANKIEVIVATTIFIISAIAIYIVPIIYLEVVGKPTADRWAVLFESKLNPNKEMYKCTELASSLQKLESLGCKDFTPLETLLANDIETRIYYGGRAQLDVVKTFFQWQYLATLAGLIGGALSALTLLGISLYGWSSSPLWVKAPFLLCSASVAFWVAVPQLYRYEENLSAAQKRYAQADTTLWQLRTVRATGRDMNGNWVTPAKYVWTLGERVADAEAIGIAFDQSKVVSLKLEKPSP